MKAEEPKLKEVFRSVLRSLEGKKADELISIFKASSASNLVQTLMKQFNQKCYKSGGKMVYPAEQEQKPQVKKFFRLVNEYLKIEPKPEPSETKKNLQMEIEFKSPDVRKQQQTQSLFQQPKPDVLKALKQSQSQGAPISQKKSNLIKFMMTATCKHFTPTHSDEEKKKQGNDKAIQSSLKDFASFKQLCRLKSHFYKSSMLADHITGKPELNNRFKAETFKILCNPEEEKRGRQTCEIELSYMEYEEKDFHRLRELKESICRAMFLYFGTILDTTHKNWSKSLARMNENETFLYLQSKQNLNQNDYTEQQEKLYRYQWLEAVQYLTQKLKYMMYTTKNQEMKQEYKECYDVILALLIAIESPQLSNMVLQIWSEQESQDL